MKRIYSEVLYGFSIDDLIDSLAQYLAAGWKPIGDPVIGLADCQNDNGTTTRRTEYFQRVIKAA